MWGVLILCALDAATTWWALRHASDDPALLVAQVVATGTAGVLAVGWWALGDLRASRTARGTTPRRGERRSAQPPASDPEAPGGRFAAILEGLHDGVLVVDAAGTVELASRRAGELLALPDDVQGRPLLDYVRVPELDALVAAARAGAAGSGEFSTSGPVSRRLLAHARALGDERPSALVVIADVTDLRRLEQQRREFVANVSHELRTPITVVQANAETLLHAEGMDPAMQRRFLEALARNAERLGRLTTDLLDLARLDAGRFALAIVDAPVSETIARVVASLRPDEVPRIHVTTAGPDLMAHVDPDALEHILANLVSNALKYSPREAPVQITAVAEADDVRLEVLDEGPGIEAAHRARIFERFYRVDPGRSREQGGTGLGLAIVRDLAEALGGSCGVEPRTPTGSCFWVRIPRGPFAPRGG
jgi:two-component system phosphate regulon sensor histidine kinase PhoR